MENEVRLIDANAFKGHLLIGAEFLDEDTLLTVLNILDCEITIDPESLRPKGHWDIRCDYRVDNVTREADENFYLECSECKRKVFDVNQMAAMNGEYRKLIEQYPHCHCGCKMEG